MTGRMRFLLGACVVAVASAAAAQPPDGGAAAKAPAPADLDKMAIEALKEVHNRGAELYNRGDPAGCYRMYEGALLTVRPFLAHRPAVAKLLDDGLAEVSRSVDGVKVQAFRLHEVIEKVRAELKKADGQTTAAPPGTGTKAPPKTPQQAPAATSGGKVGGHVTLDGKPLSGVEVTVVTLEQPQPRVFTAKTGQDGSYTFTEALPAGKYAAMVTGPAAAKVPEKFQSVTTSGLTVAVVAGEQVLDLSLMSK